MFDAVIVGARCAGAALARRLSLAGHRVALIDRATFPSDTLSSHFLWQRGGASLEKWGLRAALEARGCRPIDRITFDVGDAQLTGIGPAVGGVPVTYCPRRTVLDSMLVDAAVEAGAELIDGFVVDQVIWSEGAVTGVRGHRRGSTVTSVIDGRVVVGADGLRSTIADAVGARRYEEHPALTGVYYSYWSGVSLGASFHARAGRLVLVWPTNDELTCVYVAWPYADFDAVRGDVDRAFLDSLALVDGLRDALSAGSREARYAGTRDLPNLYRASAGPGWALIGDAGHHKDPSTGMGMSDAFASADLLADQLDGAFAGERPLIEALAEYERRRDELTADGYRLTLSTARLEPASEEFVALYRRAADDPELNEQIFGVIGGSVPSRSLRAALS